MKQVTRTSPRSWLFFLPAQAGRNEFWRYLVVNLAVIAVSVVVSVFTVVAAVLVEGSLEITEWSQVTLLIVGMLPFPFALLTLWLGHHFIHRRPFTALITPFQKITWRRVFVSGGLWFVLAALSDIILSILQPGNYTWSLELRRFVPYALLSLLLIPVQTTTEELLFRAYLPQGLSRLTRGIWLPVIISSLVFGILHGVNPEVDLYGTLYTMPFYIGIGLLLILVTLFSDSLELALGLHAANNLYASNMVTFPGSALASPALFSIKDYDAALALVVFFIMALVYTLILVRIGMFKPRQQSLNYPPSSVTPATEPTALPD